jgi:hypothetical protein
MGKKEHHIGHPLHIRVSSEDRQAACLDTTFKIIKKLFPTDFLYILSLKKYEIHPLSKTNLCKKYPTLRLH